MQETYTIPDSMYRNDLHPTTILTPTEDTALLKFDSGLSLISTQHCIFNKPDNISYH